MTVSWSLIPTSWILIHYLQEPWSWGYKNPDLEELTSVSLVSLIPSFSTGHNPNIAILDLTLSTSENKIIIPSIEAQKCPQIKNMLRISRGWEGALKWTIVSTIKYIFNVMESEINVIHSFIFLILA